MYLNLSKENTEPNTDICFQDHSIMLPEKRIKKTPTQFEVILPIIPKKPKKIKKRPKKMPHCDYKLISPLPKYHYKEDVLLICAVPCLFLLYILF